MTSTLEQQQQDFSTKKQAQSDISQKNMLMTIEKQQQAHMLQSTKMSPTSIQIEMQSQQQQAGMQGQQQLSSPGVKLAMSHMTPTATRTMTPATAINSTIIDIPSDEIEAAAATTTANTTIATETETETATTTTQITAANSLESLSDGTISASSLQRLSSVAANVVASQLSSPSSSSSASLSSYDTDSSIASNARYTRHSTTNSQHNQQQKQQQQQPQQHQQYQQQQQHLAALPTSQPSSSAAFALPYVKTVAHTAAECVASDRYDSHNNNSEKFIRTKSWPVFILLISIIEIGIFLYDYRTVQSQIQAQSPELPTPLPIPTDSVFIYRPDRRLEIWRFISYMFLHANWFHLGFNVVVQVFYGVPLEVMHGSARVAIIYLAGVFAGSLGTSVVDSDVYLVGASGGVYALLAAHLANITLNYGEMRYAVAQLVSVVIFVSCDLGYALYTQYLAGGEMITKSVPPVSYIAHLTGALAGLTIGLLVLKSFEHRTYENLIWWLALGIYSAFTVFAIAFNLINTVTAQLMEEQGEVITQHLLHDLGVS